MSFFILSILTCRMLRMTTISMAISNLVVCGTGTTDHGVHGQMPLILTFPDSIFSCRGGHGFSLDSPISVERRFST